MAQRVQVLLVDDIDGGDAAETVSFSLDGVHYEIDLSDANAGKLRKDFSNWVGHARRAGGRKRTGKRGGGAALGREDLADVRKWGRKKGYQVSDRGRVSTEVLEAYDAAH